MTQLQDDINSIPHRPDLEAKIRYRANRGMLELDLILLPFCQQHLHHLSLKELLSLAELLDCQDPDLHAWLMGITPADPEFTHVVNLIRQTLHH